MITKTNEASDWLTPEQTFQKYFSYPLDFTQPAGPKDISTSYVNIYLKLRQQRDLNSIAKSSRFLMILYFSNTLSLFPAVFQTMNSTVPLVFSMQPICISC